jgi:membrane protease YdiL (CAAX protease family)
VQQLAGQVHLYRRTLIEIGILFLPGIPAYLWIWPNLTAAHADIFQTLVYHYILVGTVFIGRRWSWDSLGLNQKGWCLTMVSGIIILAGRLLIILSIDWEVHPPPLSWVGLGWKIFFYIALVGFVEELLFRGLLYRLLLDWRGVNWAIWGSSIGFVFWHLFGQGLLVGFAALLIGLLFALIRWRAGGIAGLILLHGLWDLQSVLLVAESNAEILDLSRISFANPVGIWVGTAMLYCMPLYLWLFHPRLEALGKRVHGGKL